MFRQLTHSRRSDWTLPRAIGLTLLGAGLTAVCAQLAFYLPGNPVPVTMQVFAVILCGLALGGRLALISQLEYLVAGAAGLPVFAGFKSGVATLIGPTGGYLIGFVLAAFAVGLISDKLAPASFRVRMWAGLTGLAIIYIFGRAWLAIWTSNSWLLGIVPFMAIDVAKVAAAAAVCPRR